MAAGSYDILIEQGATFLITLTITDESGDKVDLTDVTFRGKVKKAFTDSVAQASFSFNILNQSVDATKGKVEVSLSAATTAALSVSGKGTTRTLTTMVYDIEGEDLSGKVIRWLQGNALISPEVTN